MCCIVFILIFFPFFIFVFLLQKSVVDSREGYDKYWYFYNITENILPLNKYRKQLSEEADGKILEVGIGSGFNIKNYNSSQKVVGIDYSKKMLKVSEKRIKKYNKKNIILYNMDITNMDFSDNTFDTVISNCVFCSLSDEKKALDEICRVLKPDGVLLMLEHTKSDYEILQLILKILNKFSYKFLGTSLLKDTDYLVKNKFKYVEVKNCFLKDIFKIIKAKKY